VSAEGSFLIGDRQSDADSAAAAGLPWRLIEPDTGDLLAAVRGFLGG
jgi:phosphoglycolate phosphatase-like HAD superfamily hydrolase